MASLVKNELIKIFHKKGIYFLGIVVILFGVLVAGIARWDEKITSSVENVMDEASCSGADDFDDPDIDLNEAISYKVTCDISKYKVKYDRNSEEYYYLTHTLTDQLTEAYGAKYISKNEDLYNSLISEYNTAIANIDKMDWLGEIKKTRDQKELELQELKKNQNKSNESEIKILENELYVLNYRLDNKITYTNSSESELLDSMIEVGTTYAASSDDESTYKSYIELMNKRENEKEYFITKYKLDHKLRSVHEDSIAENISMDFASISIFILFAMLIIVGGIISEEFNKGTIKQLLVKPFTRNKILFSKIIAGLIAVFVFYLFLVVVNILQWAVAYGNISTLFDPVLVYMHNGNKVVEMNIIQNLGYNFILLLPKFLIMYMFVILVGVISTSTAATIVFGFAFYILPGLLMELLSIPGKIASFIFFYCWDFEQYITGILPISGNDELMKHSSLLKSSLVCLITFIIITVISFIVFKKKDIKNQ